MVLGNTMNITQEIKEQFDLQDSKHYLEKIYIPNFPQKFNIGIIIGASGSGKTTILKDFINSNNQMDVELENFDNNPICENFNNTEEAIKYLKAVGLNSIPTWIRNINTLSMGEQYRARLGLTFSKEKKIYIIDEFTSNLDRTTARSICSSMNKGLKKENVIVATVHEDITKWLKADWIYNVETKQFRKQSIDLNYDFKIKKIPYERWGYYKNHHYLTGDLNVSSRCYEAYVDNMPAGFLAVTTLPSGTVFNAFRQHRLVTVPKYQGLGVASKLSNYIAQLYKSNNKRYFTKTANILLGEYRQRHKELYKPTSTNLSPRPAADNKNFTSWNVNKTRLTYSHEYIGQLNQKMLEDLETWNVNLLSLEEEQLKNQLTLFET